MSVTQLPSGRWRSQVWHLGLAATERRRRPRRPGELRDQARGQGRARRGPPHAPGGARGAHHRRRVSRALAHRPDLQARKALDDDHNAERTKAFAERYRSLPLHAVDDEVVASWLAGGARNETVPALRAMFNEAASAKAGRLVSANPFARLGISRGPDRADKQPPTEAQVWELIHHARRLSGPHFAAWLQVAAFVGMCPGELDALRSEHVDFERARICVAEQFSAATRTFTPPKTGVARWAPLTPPAREALLGIDRDGEFCFRSLRGDHRTPSSRAYHWKAVAAAAGWEGDLYLATRHFAGSYMVNVLNVPYEDVAIALGHTDGGQLVRRLYGHREHDRALDRVSAAFAQSTTVKPLRVVRRETA